MSEVVVPIIPENHRRRVELALLGDIKLKPTAWNIRNIMERGSLGLLYSDPGVGKTHVVVSMGASQATGVDWLGHEVVNPGPVIYCAGEGHNGLAKRFAGWFQAHGRDMAGTPLAITKGPVGLGDPEQLLEFIGAIDSLAQKIGKPVLIVIDTVARNFGPGDENSTQDMARFINACDALIAKYGCTLLLVHHTGHGDKTRFRGAMALKGALDFEYRLERRDQGDHGVIEMRAQKMKDAPLPEPLGLNMKVVEIDGLHEDDGTPVTSVVLELGERPRLDTSKHLGPNQATAMTQLRRLYNDQEANLAAAGLDPRGATVRFEDWRAGCYEAGIARNRFHDLKTTLVNGGHIRIKEPYVYLND